MRILGFVHTLPFTREHVIVVIVDYLYLSYSTLLQLLILGLFALYFRVAHTFFTRAPSRAPFSGPFFTPTSTFRHVSMYLFHPLGLKTLTESSEDPNYFSVHWPCITPLAREMGGAPRNPAPRNHLLVGIAKPSGCHCTDGHLASRGFN